MNRPYIFCHMMTSMDGKIMGSYMDTPEGGRAGAFTTLHSSKIHITAIRAVDRPVGFELKDAEVREGGSVWLGLLKR